MYGVTAKRLGVLVLVIAAARLAENLSVVWLLPNTLIAGALVALALLNAWLLYRFGSVASGTPAESLFTAAIVSIFVVPIAEIALGEIGSPWLPAILSAVPALLMWAGLLRARWVAPWIPWLGVGSAVFAAAASSLHGVLPNVLGQGLAWLEYAWAILVLVSLGRSLLGLSDRAGPDTAPAS